MITQKSLLYCKIFGFLFCILGVLAFLYINIPQYTMVLFCLMRFYHFQVMASLFI